GEPSSSNCSAAHSINRPLCVSDSGLNTDESAFVRSTLLASTVIRCWQNCNISAPNGLLRYDLSIYSWMNGYERELPILQSWSTAHAGTWSPGSPPRFSANVSRS